MSGKRAKRERRQRPTVIRAGPPGLDGTWRGTCISCLRATDTALAVRGEMEWHAAFLVKLGIPMDQAVGTVQSGLEDGIRQGAIELDENGRFDAPYRVCSTCAAKVPSFPRPVLVVPGAPVPLIAQPA